MIKFMKGCLNYHSAEFQVHGCQNEINYSFLLEIQISVRFSIKLSCFWKIDNTNKIHWNSDTTFDKPNFLDWIQFVQIDTEYVA